MYQRTLKRMGPASSLAIGAVLDSQDEAEDVLVLRPDVSFAAATSRHRIFLRRKKYWEGMSATVLNRKKRGEWVIPYAASSPIPA